LDTRSDTRLDTRLDTPDEPPDGAAKAATPIPIKKAFLHHTEHFRPPDYPRRIACPTEVGRVLRDFHRRRALRGDSSR